MDSLTQVALGAAVGEAVLGRRLGNRALLWGGLLGTLPDLDVFIPLGDAVSDFTYHRSASHSLLVLALLTPLLAWPLARLYRERCGQRGRWMLMIFLVFWTHALLDAFTAYGTQILWPLVETPVSWSTLFIIDPLYTLPLLVGTGGALVLTRKSDRGHLLNRWGLVLSTAYIAWSLAAKGIVDARVETALEQQGVEHTAVFTTPAPFNTLLWRAVVRTRDGYHEAYLSLFDGTEPVRFRAYPSADALLEPLAGSWPVARLRWFTRGFYGVQELDEQVVISDLRMGGEPHYVFRFAVAERDGAGLRPVAPVLLPAVRDWSVLPRLWARIWDPAVRVSPD